MGRAMFIKSLIQFSVDGWGCVPSPLFELRPNYVGVNEDNGESEVSYSTYQTLCDSMDCSLPGLLQKVPCTHCCTQCPQPCSKLPLTHTSTRNSWTLTGKSGLVSCGVTAPFSWVLVCTRFCLCPSSICFPSPSKFCQLCGGANGNLLQEGLCHTQVCCTQSPCPCSRPLSTYTFAGDTQTQFWLSLCGVSGSWCIQGLFQPSKCLWRVRGLILNMILPLLPSFWGLSFALGCGVIFFWWDPTFSSQWLFSSRL